MSEDLKDIGNFYAEVLQDLRVGILKFRMFIVAVLFPSVVSGYSHEDLSGIWRVNINTCSPTFGPSCCPGMLINGDNSNITIVKIGMDSDKDNKYSIQTPIKGGFIMEETNACLKSTSATFTTNYGSKYWSAQILQKTNTFGLILRIDLDYNSTTQTLLINTYEHLVRYKDGKDTQILVPSNTPIGAILLSRIEGNFPNMQPISTWRT